MLQTAATTILEDSSLIEDLGGVSNTIPNKEEINTTAPHETSVESRALDLLGSGVASEAVAAALGVSPSRISQLLSDSHFSDKVANLRYENLQSHNKRDSEYNTLEDKLLKKLDNSLDFMIKPDTILKAIQVVNGAKRRGQSAPDQTTNQNNIVTLVLPASIAQKFTINIDNQVTRAGNQELQTMTSSNLLKKVEKIDESKVIEHEREVIPNDELQNE